MITAINRSMAAKRDALKKDDKGFTLIELLVVVLIIGILAAIAIPAFLGQQNQAKDGAAKSDLGNAKIALVSYATAKNGVYSGAAAATLKDYGYVKSDNAGEIVVNLGTDGIYCISSLSSTGKNFGITNDKGVAQGTCSTAGGFTATS